MSKQSIEKVVNKSFTFLDYKVGEISFELNKDFDFSEEAEFESEFTLNHEINFYDDVFIVMLACDVFKECEYNKYPFSLSVSMFGTFSRNGEADENEIKNFCRVNAPAVLFPYLRATIGNICTLAGFPPFMLPLINVHKFLEQHSDKPE